MRIAIVGHGVSTVGRGWGWAIDMLPVVRMHNWHWQDPIDYGARCDYALIWGPWLWRDAKQIQRLPTSGFMVAALPRQILGRLTKRCDPPPYQSALFGVPVLQNTAAMRDFCERLPDCCPTRGAAAIVLAHATLGAREIVLVGMDSLVEGRLTPYPQAYAAVTGVQHGEGGPPGADKWHNFAAERDALKAWAADAGVALIPAGEIWE